MAEKFTPYTAPTFSLIGDDDHRYELSDYRGQWLVFYFYPKDDTPGCTIEACSLRDAHDNLQSNGVKVVGVSMDSPDEHRAFKAKYELSFTLLSDLMGETIRTYGAWGKKMFGVEGILRKTFLIDPEGIVRKVYGRVTPLGHGDKVLADLKTLMK
ncbi:peroxiredoxin [Candidatus Saccharibacteria bacterium]|nr:peroxiredoxin [Candidatus Saccharibacteria bacterium]